MSFGTTVMQILSLFLIGCSVAMLFILLPYLLAIAERVSPDLTVYIISACPSSYWCCVLSELVGTGRLGVGVSPPPPCEVAR